MNETMTTDGVAGETTASPRALAAAWLADFDDALQTHDVEAIDDLFLADGWWRDLVAMTWDLRTLHGTEQIKEVLRERLAETGFQALELEELEPTLIEADATTTWIEAIFRFDTALARGRGVVRLVPAEGDRAWRAWTVLTQMTELKGHEEPRGPRRPVGVTHGAQHAEGNWRSRRERQREFEDTDPAVLIVGAGQGGLGLAARLGQLDVPTLCIEKNERVGDNWRKRYASLVLHDPVWADHLPFVDFPDSWPVYTPKDKLGDWFESYVSTMELNVWTSTELLDASYDDEAEHWTVRVRRPDGRERTLRPSQLVLATGALGEPHVPVFAGIDDYRGTVHHSSAHPGGAAFAGQKALVVGACNSGHDIAQDFHEQGVDVTLVQRSSTYVMSSEHGIPALFGGLYYEGGPPTEDADLLAASYPWPVTLEFAKAQTEAIAALDRDLLDGLSRAGFNLDTGIDDGGLMSKALRSGGGYYIDVGCSKLIADGKVKVKQGAGVERFTETGIRFDDGTTLDADVIVLATGYANMRESARRLLGDGVAERCTPVWDLDEEGELNTIWRRSGHPRLWFMGGSLMIGRVYSRPLALQIQAVEEGLLSPVEGAAT